MYEKIIWSADVDSPGTLMSVLDQIQHPIKVKLDRMFLDEHGLGVMDQVASWGFDVFDDAKISEIPSKLEGVAKIHLRHKPWMLNCMVGGGLSSQVWKVEDMSDPEQRKLLDGLKLFADACHAEFTRPCGVTVLTSKKLKTVQAEYNERGSIDQVLFYTEMMVRAGFTDMVCSTEEVAAVVERFGDAIETNVPGIVMPGQDQADQARVDTPFGAIAEGATRLVVGRAITKDPVNNIEKIVANMRGEG